MGDALGRTLAIADDTVAEMRLLRQRMSRKHLRTALAVSYLRSMHRGAAGFDIDHVVQFLTTTALSGRKAAATAARVHHGLVLVQGRLATEQSGGSAGVAVVPVATGSEPSIMGAAGSVVPVEAGSVAGAEGKTVREK